MSNNGNSRSAPARKAGSMLAAVLVGMVLGLALAGGVAWYITTRPNPFVNNAAHEVVKLAPDPVKPPPAPVVKPVAEVASAVAANAGSTSAVAAVSGVGEAKPRFEFYKVLTDKPDVSLPPQASQKPADKVSAKGKKGPYFLQAGAFTNADDADKMKAKLAMLGIEASVHTATLPDKTVWHRVRLGPYKNMEELNNTLDELNQNGINATQMRVQ